jgi:anti-sigma regulatory factor (Ser/Thr protein kinase)
MTAPKYRSRQSHLELGALPSAVPSARLHARLVLGEWGLGAIAEVVELVVSELVTNAVKISRALGHQPPVVLGLCGDDHQALITVWDASGEPVQPPASEDSWPDTEAESGRGLLLVDTLSTHWGMYSYGTGRGKVVWSLVNIPTADEADPMRGRNQSPVTLLRRAATSCLMWQPAQAMDDLAVLERVREGLKSWGKRNQ